MLATNRATMKSYRIGWNMTVRQSIRRSVEKYGTQGNVRVEDELAIEEPLEIRLQDAPLAVTMRTPGHDVDLAAGFCITEGVVDQPDDIEKIEHCRESEDDNVVIVRLSTEAVERHSEQIRRAQRASFQSSSCGICGKESIERIHQQIPSITSDIQISEKTILSLPTTMRQTQATFETTGGLHAAGIFTPQGDLVTLREDVGRHNATDKVIGHHLMLGNLPLSSSILLVSGRTSFEILQKAGMAGLPMVGAISAPSSLAVDLADALGITLIGFIRDDRMNVYTHSNRIA